MSRRRALLAASSNLQGGFKANFYYDYCEESWFGKECYRSPDDLGIACYNEGIKLLQKYGISYGVYKELENPINYGFEVYIEGEIVNEIGQNEGDSSFELYYGENWARMDQDGSIYYSY